MADMRKRRPKNDLYLVDRANGLTYREIAEKYGVSFQAVAQSCAKYGAAHFKPYTEEKVVYPNLRRWLNENEITRSEFARRLGYVPIGDTMNRISEWLRGIRYPNKPAIDKILSVTGLKYEELFAEEGANNG